MWVLPPSSRPPSPGRSPSSMRRPVGRRSRSAFRCAGVVCWVSCAVPWCASGPGASWRWQPLPRMWCSRYPGSDHKMLWSDEELPRYGAW